jgi:hypothetical protein
MIKNKQTNRKPSEIIHKTRYMAALVEESMPKDAQLITGQNFEEGQSGKIAVVKRNVYRHRKKECVWSSDRHDRN